MSGLQNNFGFKMHEAYGKLPDNMQRAISMAMVAGGDPVGAIREIGAWLGPEISESRLVTGGMNTGSQFMAQATDQARGSSLESALG